MGERDSGEVDGKAVNGKERRPRLDGDGIGVPTAAAVVCPLLSATRGADQPDNHIRPRSAAARMAEAVGLAHAIALDVRLCETVTVRRTAPATLLGAGTVERLKGTIAEEGIAVAIVDARLTPVQQRNLERAWQCKVIDRTGLILEIFGERARTHEGRLQVELAALDYQRSRLVRSWTHLERQRGGFGFLGGPGESQLEIDRRLIGDRILKIKHELEQVRRTRGLHRAGRQRGSLPTVAFVGYTNAGKSTLFNRISGAEVLAKDLLFATLDPTMRAVRLPNGQRAILSDTVGFIADLPTTLVAAFRATLEEVVEADLIVHVRDVADPESERQKSDVEAVLRQLGLEDRMAAGGVIEACNKIDLLDDEARERLERLTATGAERRRVFAISAATGEGIESLLIEIGERLSSTDGAVEVDVPLSDGATIAWLYRHGEVRARRDADSTAHFTVALDAESKARLSARLGRSH
ncbi:MAG TPA: GTPase HflX [Vineibacter sp.]|nr:GTPase HflX [Vineibacter sp.]